MNGNCVNCQRPATSFCSSCGPRVAYCSAACQREHWPTHRARCTANRSRETSTNPFQPQAPQESDAVFYLKQMYMLLIPVTMNIILSILWVKLSRPTPPYFGSLVNAGNGAPSVRQVFAGDNVNQDDSLKSALIIMGQIVGFTLFILFLVKMKLFKVCPSHLSPRINCVGSVWHPFYDPTRGSWSVWIPRLIDVTGKIQFAA